jgi:dipeptidyl-peptidase-4
MKTFRAKYLCLILLLTPLAVLSQNKVNIDLQTMWNNYILYPKGVEGINMLPDGKTFAQFDYNLKTSSSNILLKMLSNNKTVDTFFSSSWIPNLSKGFYVEDYSISPTGNFILIQTNSNNIYRHSKESEYYLFDRSKKSITSVNNKKRVFYATLSPDEKHIAYIYRNNLYLQEVSDGSTKSVTQDGAINNIINGKSDWVYEEEFALVRSFEWSPDSKHLAYYRFDESKVKEYQLPFYDSIYPDQYHYKYPVAGEANSIIQIWLYEVNTGKKVQADIGPEVDQYIPRIKWTSDPGVLSIERLNRLQNKLDLLKVNAQNGNSTIILTETSDSYIEITDNLFFLKDNSFILTSDKGGFNQIYKYGSDGKNETLITTNKEDVETVFGVSEKSGTVYYSAFSPTPLDKTVYGINLKSGKKTPLVNNQKGKNTPIFNPDFSYFILSSSTIKQPPLIALYNIKGKKIRTLEDNEALKNLIDQAGLPKKEFFKLSLNDTLRLDAWIIRPPNFDSTKKYPVLLTVYGGPGYQTVKNEWGSMNDIWFAWLATKGYIVISVNNRGGGGQGAAFRKLTYKKTGIEESNDFIETGKWLGRQPYVDAGRIGIWGWSFGGYMSLMCITRGSDVFKTAISVAPVTDWHFYDNIYTERYMQRPSDNPEGYRNTSVFNYANQLKGNLLLIAGTFDDNVHPANSLEFMTEMIRLNKKYDTEFYPNKNHGIYGGNTRLHLFTRMTDYLLEHL